MQTNGLGGAPGYQDNPAVTTQIGFNGGGGINSDVGNGYAIGAMGDIYYGNRPYIGGSPQALDSYLAQQQKNQQGLQYAAVVAQGQQAPQANYANTLANQSAGRGGLAAQYQGAQAGVQQAGGYMQGMANGTAPSAAEIQQNQGVSQALRSQLTAAASTRGGAAQQAAAQQQAGMNGANLQAQGIGAAAQMRLQAQNQAQQAYAQNQQALLGAAGQQQGLAAKQAGMNQSAQLHQTGLNNQYSLGLGQQALGYGNQGLSAMQSQASADTAYGGLQLQATENTAKQTQDMLGGITGGLGGLAGMMGSMSDIRVKQDIQPVDGGKRPWQVQMHDAVDLQPVPKEHLAPPPRGGMDKAQALAFLKGQPWQVTTGQAQDVQPLPPPQAAPAISSDERGKDAGPAGGVADEYLEHLARSAATYSYKDPSKAPAQRAPGAKFGGVMAQDPRERARDWPPARDRHPQWQDPGGRRELVRRAHGYRPHVRAPEGPREPRGPLMPLASPSYLPFNQPFDPNQPAPNPYALDQIAPPQPSVEQPAPPPPSLQQAAMAPPPMQGVGYTPGASAAQQPGVPAQPGYSISPEEALKLAGVGAGKPQKAGFTPTTRSESAEGRAASPEFEQATANKLEADAGATVAQSQYDQAVWRLPSGRPT